MDESTFPDPRVRETIEKNFVPVRIDTTTDQRTPTEYRVNGIPTMFVLDADGEPVSRVVGFVPPDDLFGFLKKTLT